MKCILTIIFLLTNLYYIGYCFSQLANLDLTFGDKGILKLQGSPISFSILDSNLFIYPVLYISCKILAP